MRKTILCVMMATAMASGVVGCGSSQTAATTAAETTAQESSEAKATEAETTEEETTEEVTAEETTEEETKTEETSELQVGTWDGTVFSNEWLNLSLTFPEDVHIATEEEVQASLGAGQEVLVNTGTYTQAQLDLSQALSVYDFMVVMPDAVSSIQLMYENTRLSTLGMGISAEDYLDAVEAQLTALTEMEYEVVESGTVTLAGNTFNRLTLSALGGLMYQDYCCMEKDGYMVNIVATYREDSKSVMDEIFDSAAAIQ